MSQVGVSVDAAEWCPRGDSIAKLALSPFLGRTPAADTKEAERNGKSERVIERRAIC